MGTLLDVRTTAPRLKEPLAAAVRVIEEDIIFGRLKPRQRLIEDALMERFDFKRHVARQALAALEQIGVVTREPNKGARVRSFSPQEIAAIYDVRFLLHGHAARTMPLPAPPELLDRLGELRERHAKAVEAGDLSAVHRYDNEFHDTLFAACGNPYLFDTIKAYAAIAHVVRYHSIGQPRRLGRSQVEHLQMIEALRDDDRERLARLCVDHIKPSMEAYLAAGRDED